MKLIDANCDLYLQSFVTASYAPLVGDSGAILSAFISAECCRLHGEFAAATRFVDAISGSPLAAENCVQDAIARHRERLIKEDRTPLLNEEIAHFVPVLTESHRLPEKAGIIQKGINFTWAIANWAASGFATRTDEQINERLAICRACPELVNDHCQLCGCACVDANRLINKLALATEKCPLGKWE